MMPDWLTLSGEFVSIWSTRLAVWSATLVDLVIICSKECVWQNSKYDLVRWGISLLIAFADLCPKISLSLTANLYCCRQEDLDLGRKIFLKILSVLMQKLGFSLYEKEFLTTQAAPPPLRDWSDLTRHILLFKTHYSKLYCQV